MSSDKCGNNAKSLRSIYSKRLRMMSKGVTAVPQSLQSEVGRMVEALERLDDDEFIEINIGEKSSTFVIESTGVEIAYLPITSMGPD